MNLIGKIFVVIIVVLSVLFMGLSMAVYSTHKNWKAAVDTQKTEIDKIKNEYEQYKSQYGLVESNLRLEIDSAEQQVSKLESERVLRETQNVEIQEELKKLKEASRDATAAVASTQENNAQLARKNAGLQTDIITAQEASDAAFAKTLDATSKLHDAAIKLNAELERNAELTGQIAGMTAVMRRNGIDPATRPGDVKPSVNGYVSDITRKAGSETIELTIGADDGLKRGHTLEVFRNDKYLG
ncbi:MAG: hypothetical protein ACR2NU_03900, partial [Aeoliella sp.]